ncbi:MAG: alpha/beta hydrolase [Chloroflexi bacterium]|nr:alpha/beta hydrolase [Chloroflexota bacterium]
MSQPANLPLKHLTRFPAGDAAPHPTIICLHGRGSNEGDLISLAPYLDDRLLWISPRAPLDLMGGWEWYRLEGIGAPDQPSFDAALETLDRFITEAVAAYPVDPQRLFLLGFSQGSMMSYSFALTQPARVAGVIAQSGYIPLSSGLKVDEAGLKGKPFVITHGTHDPLLPVQWGRDSYETLKRLGAEVEFHEFRMGHNVSDESIEVIAEWMKKRL